jgi:iron complex transport system substrate-binding protein
MDPNIEAIVALRPDLVLMATSGRAADRLEALGLRVMAMEPKTHAEVLSGLQRLGRALQTGQADQIWRSMHQDIVALAAQMPAAALGKRVYVQVSPAPHAAGEASFIGETLGLLGLQNIVPRSMGVFPQLAPEYVVRADPDIILVAQSQWSALRNRPGWSAMKAVQRERVCAFTPEQNDMLARPGPRLVEAARWVLDCMKRLKL